MQDSGTPYLFLDGYLPLCSTEAEMEAEKPEKTPEISRRRANAILLTCFIECLLLTGAMFGWPSLAYVLKEDGIFSQFCQSQPEAKVKKFQADANITQAGNGTHYSNHRPSNFSGPIALTDIENSVSINISEYYASFLNQSSPLTCTEQDSKLSIAFTFGISAYSILAFFNGWLFDRFGLRTVRLCAWALGTIAYVILALMKSGASSWLIYPGMVALGIASNISIMTNCYVCKLGGRRTSTFITLYNGALNTSAAVYLVFKIAYGAGISRAYILIAYAVLYSLTLFSTVFILPKDKLTTNNELHMNVPEKKPLAQQNQRETEATSTVRSLILSPLYFCYIFWFSMLHVRTMCFISFFSSWIQLMNEKQEESHYTTVYGLIQMSGLIIAPIAGILIDIRRKYLSEKKIMGKKKAIAVLAPVSISTIAVIALSIQVFIPSKILIYVTMIVQEILRGFLYATAIAFLEIVYPSCHYGIMFGCSFVSIGLASLLQFPYTTWLEISGLMPVNMLLLVISCLTMVLPAYIIFKHWFLRKK